MNCSCRCRKKQNVRVFEPEQVWAKENNLRLNASECKELKILPTKARARKVQQGKKMLVLHSWFENVELGADSNQIIKS